MFFFRIFFAHLLTLEITLGGYVRTHFATRKVKLSEAYTAHDAFLRTGSRANIGDDSTNF